MRLDAELLRARELLTPAECAVVFREGRDYWVRQCELGTVDWVERAGGRRLIVRASAERHALGLGRLHRARDDGPVDALAEAKRRFRRSVARVCHG